MAGPDGQRDLTLIPMPMLNLDRPALEFVNGGDKPEHKNQQRDGGNDLIGAPRFGGLVFEFSVFRFVPPGIIDA